MIDTNAAGPAQPASAERTAAGQDPVRTRVVALGASAGGLAAFEKFFRAIEGATGLAFVVVQHLSPEHESILPQLLSAFTRMPVEPVSSGVAPLPDHVYVIPPNATLVFRSGRLCLETIEPRAFRQPISAFFGSLAAELGPDAIAVVLSGTGSDGAAGLHAVRTRGGLTLVQSPSEAQYDSMPRSAVATGEVDLVVAAADMPGLIQRELRRRESAPPDPPEPPLGADPLALVTDALRRQARKEFAGFKRSTLLRRVQRRLSMLGIPSIAEYAARLEVDGAEAQALAGDLMIGVTRFFRDPAAFAALDAHVLPRLFQTAGDQQVRVWVPGCASGEEAYSIAIQLTAHLRRAEGPGARARVQVFATDINDAALGVARAGRYPEAIVSEVAPEWLERWFVREEGGFQVAKEIRDACIFSMHDVLRDPPFSRVDLISCRNLLIYLDPAMQGRVLPLFHYALRPSGFLFLGSSEDVGDMGGLFEPLDPKHRIFRRSEGAGPRVRFPLTAAPIARRTDRIAEADPDAAAGADVLRPLIAGVLEEQVAAAALVDGRGVARYFAGAVSRFLPTPTGA